MAQAQIWSYDYDVAHGTVDEATRRIFVDFEAAGHPGVPDGSTVDAAGRLRRGRQIYFALSFGARDRASPNFWGWPVGVRNGYFCDSLYSVFLSNAGLGLDFLGLAAYRSPRVTFPVPTGIRSSQQLFILYLLKVHVKEFNG